MTNSELRINNYALRNALLLVAYGVIGILLLPRLLAYFEDVPSAMFWVVRVGVLILYLSYIFIGYTAMMTPRKIRENHQLVNILFLVVFIDCIFLGFYITSKDGFRSAAMTALALSSLIIAGVVVYYFTKFQIKSKEAKALQNMSAMLLIFSGGGEIFFHHVPYVNTIVGWFIIWIALCSPGRQIWRSFAYSVIISAMFYIPRVELSILGEGNPTLMNLLRRFIVENEIPPLYFIYIYFGAILLISFIILNVKIKLERGETKSDVIETESPQLVKNK